MRSALFSKDYSNRTTFTEQFLDKAKCPIGIYIYPKNREKQIERLPVLNYFTYENIGETENWLKIDSLISDQTAIFFDNPSRYPKISSPKHGFLSRLSKLAKNKAILDIVPFTLDIQYLYTPFSYLGREILGYAHYYAFRENYKELDKDGNVRFSHDFDLLADKVVNVSEIDYFNFLCPNRRIINVQSTEDEIQSYSALRSELFDAKSFSPSVTITKLSDHVHAFESRMTALIELLATLKGKTVVLTNLKSYAKTAEKAAKDAGCEVTATSYQLGINDNFDNCIYLESPIVKSYYLLDIESQLNPDCQVFHIVGDTKVDQHLFKTLSDEITQINKFTQELYCAKRRQASPKAIPTKECITSSSGANQLALF
jgi:hypothetical protein